MASSGKRFQAGIVKRYLALKSRQVIPKQKFSLKNTSFQSKQRGRGVTYLYKPSAFASGLNIGIFLRRARVEDDFSPNKVFNFL